MTTHFKEIKFQYGQLYLMFLVQIRYFISLKHLQDLLVACCCTVAGCRKQNNFKRMYGGFPFLFDLFIAWLKYWISPYVVSCQFLSEQFVWSFRPVQRNQVYVHIVKFKLENLQIQANPHAQ